MNKIAKAKDDSVFSILFSLSKGAESRKRILSSLFLGPKNCNQISKELGLDWWTVKKHLLILSNEHIVKSMQFGNSKFYKLTPVGEEALKLIQQN